MQMHDIKGIIDKNMIIKIETFGKIQHCFMILKNCIIGHGTSIMAHAYNPSYSGD
jgi:hypothetical protein